MADWTAELVGYVTAENPGGSAGHVYACIEHTPEHRKQSHRMVFRDEANHGGVKCAVCKVELVDAPAEVLA